VKQLILWPVSLAVACWLYGQTLPAPAAPPPASPAATPGVTYRDITASAGLGAFIHTSGTALKNYILEAPGSGSAFLDYDRDGWLDIYLVSGSTHDALRGKARAPGAALFRNNHDGTFADVTGKAGMSNYRWGQGVCAADYNNDGWQDVYVTNYGKNRLYHNNGDVLLNNLDGPPTLLRNDGGNSAGHWLLVRLVGDVAQKCPRDAIGSVVFCTARGVRMRGEVASGRSHMSQSDLRVHFGLGAATAVDLLEVRWSNGRTVAYKIPKVDTVITIDQARGLTVN
jgi:hypothetical protein